ncbi:MAG: tRNA (adenosine(37)-N6)-threonylcarbamoyltransferase complex dimerization subunit type 1 TsaB [Candidatus Omnitrophica bacterium]|nr:tRNA (adenosine(37)-N6)-threonylcarbamoyltransferase complex dimerization subunit type 1 TsaB [Candidatus Omnitrophota bacterium]
MKILALDTSSRFLCLGFYDSGKVFEYTLETSTRLSHVLTATISRCLQALGWDARDIDCFSCGRGPGSFTGVRIGMSVIKGLSWALKKPVVGIPTLDVIARNAGNAAGEVVTIVDARRSLVY